MHDYLEWIDSTRHQQLESWTRSETLLTSACRKAVVGLLRPWAKAHLVAEDERAAIETIQFPPDCPTELRAALCAPPITEPHNDWQLAAWSVRAEALATEFLAITPSRVAAEALYDVDYAPVPFWRALEQHLARAENEHQGAWIAFLTSPQVDLVEALSRETDLAFNRLADDWAHRRGPFAIFHPGYQRSRPSQGPVGEWERTRMSLLLSISPEAWLHAIDKLPLPTMMWEAVEFLQLRSNPTLVARLIANAPPVFDAGVAWTGSVAAVMVSDLVPDQLRTIHNAVHRATTTFGLAAPLATQLIDRAKERLHALEHGELQAWAASAYASLLRHPNGEAIAFELLARLSRTEILGEWNHQPNAWSANQTALAGIVRAFIDNGVPLSKLKAWWQRREAEAAGGPQATDKVRDASSTAASLFADGLTYLVGAITILCGRYPNAREALGGDAALLWGWATQLFLGRDPGLDLLPLARSQSGFMWLGYLMAAQHRPDQAWQAVYGQLAPQRRRHARHAFEPDGRSLHGSHDLVLTGLYALAQWSQVAPVDEMPVIIGFQQDLSKAAQQMYLTAPTSNRPSAAQLVASCFAPARSLFGNDVSDYLTDMLRPLANDPLIVRAVRDVLARNQVTDEILNSVGERLGIDLAATLAFADRLSPRK